MPVIKAEPEDIIRKQDALEMIKKLQEIEGSENVTLKYKWKTMKGKPKQVNLWIRPLMIAALISFLFLFGKRITEVLKLKRKHIYTKRGYLYVNFQILKRKRRIENEKRILRKHFEKKRVHIEKSKPFSNIIISYANKLDHPESWLFPGNSRPHVQVVRNKKTGKVYRYEHKDKNRMSRQHAYMILKALNPDFYPHYFRHSLATNLAEDPKIGPIELQAWFDWEKIETATNYIHKTLRMTRHISDRKV